MKHLLRSIVTLGLALLALSLIAGRPVDAHGSISIAAQPDRVAKPAYGVCVATPNNGSYSTSSLQDAINHATPGAIVKVAGHCDYWDYQGGYSQTAIITKPLTIKGGYDPDLQNWTIEPSVISRTIIDGVGVARVVLISGTVASLQNLVIQNGRAGAAPNCSLCGGGISANRNITLTNVHVLSNVSDYEGGGIWTGDVNLSSTLTLINSLIQNNVSHYEGGGLEAYAVIMTNTQLISNTADQFHGGAAVFLTATISGGLFQANSAGGLSASQVEISGTQFIANTNSVGGGGASISNGNIVNSLFISNTSTTNGLSIRGGGGLEVGSFGAVTVSNTRFINNSAAYRGGGISMGGSLAGWYDSLTLTNVLLQGNYCTETNCNGGAIFTEGPLYVVNTQILSNSATGRGGGLFLIPKSGDSVRLIGNLLQGNTCIAAGCNGGGLNAYALNATPQLIDNRFINNAAVSKGGGAYVDNGAVQITGGVFDRNQTTDSFGYGGGLFANQVWLTGTKFTANEAYGASAVYLSGTQYSRVVNAVFARNFYGPLSGVVLGVNGGTVDVLHSTIVSPTLANMYGIFVLKGTLNLTNTIIASQTVGVDYTGSGATQGDYNLYYGNGSDFGTFSFGTHNQAGNPRFKNQAIDDYHLLGGSAAINTGANAGVSIDLDGRSRPIGGSFDIGAYEYDSPITGLSAINNSPKQIGQTTRLTATLGAGTTVTYTWNFGDGTALGLGKTLTHTYPAVGYYTARVTATNSSNSVVATTRVTITNVPITGLSAINNSPTKISGSTRLTATISTGSSITYTWNFGDGATLGSGKNISHTYSLWGWFTATVTATNSVSIMTATTPVLIIPYQLELPLVLKNF